MGLAKSMRPSQAGDKVLGMRISRAVLVSSLAVLAGAWAVHAYPQPSSTTAPSAPQPVIIDTDIGDDIDDAFALALALKSPELKILGVTTTFGDTALRARLTQRYLQAAGRGDIPVFAGPPSSTDNLMTQAAYAKRQPARKFDDGADFILRTAREHPGQITLIGIGPLFTVQAAIQRDPAAFRQLKRVVIMGGCIERGYDGAGGEKRPPEPEWNIDRNPAGARALFSAGVPVFMMPLDSTQVHLDANGREAIFAHGSPITDQVTLLYHQWMAGTPSHSPTPTLFDPVAVTWTFRPDLCPTQPMHIEVDDRGMTTRGPGPPNAQVCLHSDEKGFLQLLLARLTGD